MASESLELFFTALARHPRARQLVSRAFSRECERSMECRRCVETRVHYWYMRWLFGTLADPVKAAEDIARCVEEHAGGGGRG